RMVTRPQRQAAAESGAAMVEMTIVIPILLTLVLGFVDLGFAFYQWNAANKAVQIGARLAEVSSPVATGLTLEGAIPADTTQVGNAVPANTYDYLCSSTAGGTVSCSCAGGTCQNLTVNTAAFNLIYNGDATRPGMVTFFP